ncbi:MAG: hypothetical protein ACRCYU_08115 [Nocardioides sp.]
MRELFAFVGRELLGVFHETAEGDAIFEYADSNVTTPLSLSRPRGHTMIPETGINYLDKPAA